MEPSLQKFKFRELHDEQELTQFMKLRYDKYLSSPMKNFIDINPHKIDIDIYDLQSRHFGLFCEDEPGGFLRIVYPKMEVYQENVFNIGRRYNVFCPDKHSAANIERLDYPEFPFISYPKVPRPIQQFYDSLCAKNEKLVEPSRLMLFQNVQGLSKAKFLAECAIVIYVMTCMGSKHAVINCDTRHGRFYQRYGFYHLENKEEYNVNTIESSLQVLSMADCLQTSPVAEEYREMLEAMVEEFSTTNELVRMI